MPTDTNAIVIPSALTVQIDTREKYPLLFPSNIYVEDPSKANVPVLVSIATEHLALKTGDYRLKEYPDSCVVERKASQQELIKNLFNTKDFARQSASFARLASCCTHPILLLETTPLELASSKYIDNPDRLLNRITRVSNYYGFQLFFAGRSSSATGRRALGSFLLHTMVGYSLYPNLFSRRGSRLGEESGSPAPSQLFTQEVI